MDRRRGKQSKGSGPTPTSLQRHIEQFPNAAVLVVGDLMLDHYIWGKVSRISPEAPVPVVHVNSESWQLGGASNVYNNIVALGGRTELCGVVGADERCRRRLDALCTSRGGRAGVVIDAERPTTTKTRVAAPPLSGASR